MTTTTQERTIIGIIWDNLLEDVSEALRETGQVKQLTCGCLVTSDGDYLDLFVGLNTFGYCDQEYAHDVILATRPFSDEPGTTDPADWEQLTAAVEGYIDGWPDEDRTIIRALIGEVRP